MKRASILQILIAALVFVGTFALARPAAALGPIDLEVGAKVGYGTTPIKGGGPIDPLGVGVGARAGIGIMSIYAGVQIQYYFGGDTQAPNGMLTASGAPATSKLSESSLLYGVEGGYSFSILFLTIRPQIGVGNYMLHSSFEGSSTTHNSLYIEPGATALINIGIVYFGADANVLLTPGLDNSRAAFTFDGQLGLKF